MGMDNDGIENCRELGIEFEIAGEAGGTYQWDRRVHQSMVVVDAERSDLMTPGTSNSCPQSILRPTDEGGMVDIYKLA